MCDTHDAGRSSLARRAPRDVWHVWEFHNYRRSLIAKCEPTKGQRLIARYEQQRPVGCTVVTQNIDGLHQRAGSQRVHELHGSIRQLRCDRCSYRDETRAAPLEELHCPSCKTAYKRPNIVWRSATHCFPKS